MLNKGFQLFISLSLFVLSCSTTAVEKKSSAQKNEPPGFYLKNQILPPNHIKSVSLAHSGGYSQAIPFFKLQSGETLTLRFDELTDNPTSFGIRFSRKNKNWEDDGQVPTQISSGQLEDIIEQGKRSNDEFPEFFQFDYSFPNSRFQPKLSGNWMVEVFDYHSGETVFSHPFLIGEQMGSIQVQTKTLNEMNQQSRYQHQHFVFYSFPGSSIQLPEYNTSVFIVQDGRFRLQKVLPITDFTRRSENIIRYHHERTDLFAANYDHQLLQMKKLRDSDVIRFVEERGPNPPSVLLYDNNPAFEQTTANELFNKPSTDKFDRYVEVEFSFIPNWEILPEDQVFVTGSFAQQALKMQHELKWNGTEHRFKGSILLKQGIYEYSYEVLRAGRWEPQLAQNQFGSTKRFYTVLIYYNDPTRFIDRLLYVNEFVTN